MTDLPLPPKPWLWREAPTTVQNMERLLADLDPLLVREALTPFLDAFAHQDANKHANPDQVLLGGLQLNVEQNGLIPPGVRRDD